MSKVSKASILGALVLAILVPPVPIGCAMMKIEAARGGEAYSNMLFQRPDLFLEVWAGFSFLVFIGAVVEAKRRSRSPRRESLPDKIGER